MTEHRDRLTLVVVAILGAAVGVLAAESIAASATDRIAVVTGNILLGFAIAVFARRALAVAPREDHSGPFAKLLAGWIEAVESLRRNQAGRLGIVGFIAGLVTGAKASWWVAIVTASAIYGAFLAQSVVLALAVGGGVTFAVEFDSIVEQLAEYRNPPHILPIYAIVVGGFVLQSIVVIPWWIRAYRALSPIRRTRFEIGGLGTRVEDLTPQEHRDLAAPTARFCLAIGSLLVGYGGGSTELGVAAIALTTGPAIALLASQLGAPLIVLAAFSVTAFPAFFGFAVIASTIALATDAARFAALRRTRPRDAQGTFVIAALILGSIAAAFGSPQEIHHESIVLPVLGYVELATIGIVIVVCALRAGSDLDSDRPNLSAIDPASSRAPHGVALLAAACVAGCVLPTLCVAALFCSSFAAFLWRQLEIPLRAEVVLGGVCIGFAFIAALCALL